MYSVSIVNDATTWCVDSFLADTCERYGGQFCSSLSGYTERSVYLNREGWSSVSLGDIEGSMVGLYHSLGGNGLSPACQNALTLLICHGSLPFCKDGGLLIFNYLWLAIV